MHAHARAQMPVLIAIDDYNTFWLKSEFFKCVVSGVARVTTTHRVCRPVGEGEDEDYVDAYTDDIRVAKALRMLAGPMLDNGVVVAAMSQRCGATCDGMCSQRVLTVRGRAPS